MKIRSKREPQQIAFNHSSDNDCQDLISFYKRSTKEPCSLFMN